MTHNGLYLKLNDASDLIIKILKICFAEIFIEKKSRYKI
jgi:hypothetical protein